MPNKNREETTFLRFGTGKKENFEADGCKRFFLLCPMTWFFRGNAKNAAKSACAPDTPSEKRCVDKQKKSRDHSLPSVVRIFRPVVFRFLRQIFLFFQTQLRYDGHAFWESSTNVSTLCSDFKKTSLTSFPSL